MSEFDDDNDFLLPPSLHIEGWTIRIDMIGVISPIMSGTQNYYFNIILTVGSIITISNNNIRKLVNQYEIFYREYIMDDEYKYPKNLLPFINN